MECANCGKLGHTFRDCCEPVTSYGILAIKMTEGIPHYLLIRRRDSLSYVEFLRGKYKMDNIDYIQLLINGMTIAEKERLLTQAFDMLWENLWNSQNTRQYRQEYESAKRHFEQLKNTGDVYGKLLSRYIEISDTAWAEPEWGFPKGRRSVRETEVDCALREFEEETALSRRIVHLVDDVSPESELYVGTNGIPYRQVYFIGGCASNSTATHQPSNRVMSREVGDIGWFLFEEAYLKIRPTNAEKRAVLGRVHHRVMREGLSDKIAGALEWSRG